MAKNKKNALIDNELDLKNSKVRITTFIDGDVLLELKRMAEKKGMAYQSLLNSILRASTIDKVDFINYQISKRFQMVQQEMDSLYKDLKVAAKKSKSAKATKRVSSKR